MLSPLQTFKSHSHCRVAALLSIVLASAHVSINIDADDRVWLISTRGISSDTCRANLTAPSLAVSRVTCTGVVTSSSLEDYLEQIALSQSTVIYIHGNRMEARDVIGRGLTIYRASRRCHAEGDIDWVIWSWPSGKEGSIFEDVRRKASRTDAQGLYLSWLIRRHIESQASTSLVGYSFGSRIATGALHALAGGQLGGRRIPEPAIVGTKIGASLIAPAIANDWLAPRGYHALATKNLNRLTLLYNRRDVILKRYWIIDRVRGTTALGYSGPRTFGRRADGSRLPVRSRDCSADLGLAHDELDYYFKACSAGSEVASLIANVNANKVVDEIEIVE